MRTIGNYTYEFDRGVFGGYALYINGAYSGRTFGSVEEYTAFAGALAEVIPYKAASSTFLSIPIRHYSGLSCYIVGSSGDMLIEDYYAKLEWYNDIYK